MNGWVIFSMSAVPIVLVFGLLYFAIFNPLRKLAKLKGTGIQGEATALDYPILDANTSNVHGSVTLRVSVEGQEPYKVTTTAMINKSKYRALSECTLPVWIDPKNPQRVYIDWEHVPSKDELIARL